MILLNKLECHIQHHLFKIVKMKLCTCDTHKNIVKFTNAKLKIKLLGYYNKRLEDKTIFSIT